tara:strand:+ start:387 stop:1013 length:627 start_codon:yes stop_codon:yes gene_type:complete
MNIDTDTCWYDTDTSSELMIKGAAAALPGWRKLEYSDHFPALKSLVDEVQNECTLLDIGCGAAEASRVFNFFYVGADLASVIENVSRKVHPGKRFLAFDIYDQTDDLSFISEYDVVLMNAFIDVLQHPLYGLDRILKKAQKYVILHRQEFDNNETRCVKNPSYGGVTYHSIINVDEFNNTLKDNGFEVVKEESVPYSGEVKSLLLKKI